MTKQELAAALEVARSDKDINEDDTCLHGLYLKDFPAPVHTTINVVAKFMRHLVIYLNGMVDCEALAEFSTVARKRIRIVG